MSVLIKGMEMPTSCPCELCGYGYDLYCFAVNGIPARVAEYYESCETKIRPDWCPLAEVPQHGRLIDADALIASIRPVHEEDSYVACTLKTTKELMINNICNAPTVIEAEGET